MLNLTFMIIFQTYAYLYVLGGLLLIIVLSVFLNDRRQRRWLRLQVRLVESTDQQIRQLSLEGSLAKLGDLAKFNASFIPIYDQFVTEVPEFRQSYESELRSHLDELSHTLGDQKYKFVREKLPQVQTLLRKQRKLADELLNKMESYTEMERSLLREYEPIEKDLERALVRVEQKADYYAPVKESLTLWVQRFYGDAQVFKDYLRFGDYGEAKNLLKSLQEQQLHILQWIDFNLGPLEWIMSYVDKRVNPIIERYEQLSKEGYSFTNLPFLTYIKDVRYRIDELLAAMRDGTYVDAHSDMQELENAMKSFSKAFDEEVAARKIYDSKFKPVTERALAIAAEFSNRWMRETTSLNTVYTFTGEMEMTLSQFRDHISNMNSLRNEVDSARYNNYPYTLQLDRLNKLEEMVKQVEGTQEVYRSTTQAMKEVMEQSHLLLVESFNELKRLEWRLRQPQFPPLLDFFDPYFIHTNQLQNECGKLLKNMPLDLVQLRQVSQQLKQSLAELTSLVAIKLQELVEAEKILLLANRFRPSFGEVERVSQRAESFFDSCDFKSAIEVTGDVLARNKLVSLR